MTIIASSATASNVEDRNQEEESEDCFDEERQPVPCEGEGDSDGTQDEDGILQFIQERPVQSSVVAVSSLTMIGFAISSESIRWPVTHRFWLSMAFVFGLVKKRKDGEFQRGRVLGIIQSNPGIHLSALVRTAELGNNHTAHILEVLQQDGYIWNRKVGKQVRFFSSEISSDLETTELPSHAESLVQDSIPHQILMHLNRVELIGEKPPNGKTLAKELQISTELLSYHIRQLEASNYVSRKRNGVSFRIYITSVGINVITGVVESLAIGGMDESIQSEL
jgi:DNA-binding HxlR family transcriptional regulator